MWKNFEMVEQKDRTRIAQSGKNCAINCATQGLRFIWKQKIWLAIYEFLWLLTNQNAWFVSSFCTELTLFCTVFEKNCSALNQLEWGNFFMYISSIQTKVLDYTSCINLVLLASLRTLYRKKWAMHLWDSFVAREKETLGHESVWRYLLIY